MIKSIRRKLYIRNLEKSEAEISKWLSGMHNLTLRSIAKLEAALEKDIILTPQRASTAFSQIQYVYMRAYSKPSTLPGDSDYIEEDFQAESYSEDSDKSRAA